MRRQLCSAVIRYAVMCSMVTVGCDSRCNQASMKTGRCNTTRHPRSHDDSVTSDKSDSATDGGAMPDAEVRSSSAADGGHRDQDGAASSERGDAASDAAP